MSARLAALVALAVALSWSAAAQNQTFHSSVDVVRVDALVTDGKKPIAGLTPSDFELRDNGVVQTIDAAALETLPLSVIFVLDTSGSVAGDKMRHLGDGVDSVLKGLHGGDRAALVTFSHRVWLRTPLMSDFAKLRQTMASTEAKGGTALYDAVYAALATSDVEDSRPLLLVFSDGLDNISWMSADIVQEAARRANAVVYGVAVAAEMAYKRPGALSGRGGMYPQYVKGQTDFLEHVADVTGGRLIKADTTTNLPQAFDEILREFRTRYLLSYTPSGVDAPGWHHIELKVKGRKAEVRARTGYQK